MSNIFGKLRNLSRINIFIVFSVIIIMAFSMILAGILFYTKTAEVLSGVYREEIVRELGQVSRNVQDQLAAIDSVYVMLLANTLIRDNLDPTAEGYALFTENERKLEIERQMGYTLVNSYLWAKNLINGVYIFDTEGVCASFSAMDAPGIAMSYAHDVTQKLDLTTHELQIRALDGVHDSIYFSRNIFSMNSGNKIATVVVDFNSHEWARLFATGADENWLITLNNADIQWSIGPETYDDGQIAALIAAAENHHGFQEAVVQGTEYFIASNKTDAAELTTAVIAPKEYLLRDLSQARSSFLTMYFIIALVSMLFTVLVIVLVTSPIKQMTDYVRAVSRNRADAKRPKGLFKELDEFAEAFNTLLDKQEIYYSDLYEQEVLLKNAEIKALQAQIDPHFLFNVMNTIAWKAEMSGNSEVYEMVISLCEMLQANTLSKDRAFITLKEELDYVRLYIYLQQKRFDGKFSVDFDCQTVPETAQVPRFSIQPLVENAILHGFEPLPDDGRSWLLTVRVKPDGNGIRVWVEDNGTGFPDDFDIDEVKSPQDGEHSRIALKNLNQRLAWIGGAGSSLSISREESKTIVSFWLPGEG